MKGSRPASFHRRVTVSLLLTAILTVGLAGATIAHPLGNFTINHFARIETGTERVLIHYVVDMAEIPTLQELQGMNADANEDLLYTSVLKKAEAEGVSLQSGGNKERGRGDSKD